MYFVLNEGPKEDRFEATSNVEFFSSIDALRRNTEPQDFEHGDHHVTDSDGFEYDIRYTPRPNSVEIVRGHRSSTSVERMVKKVLVEHGGKYDERLSIEKNIELAEIEGKIQVCR